MLRLMLRLMLLAVRSLVGLEAVLPSEMVQEEASMGDVRVLDGEDKGWDSLWDSLANVCYFSCRYACSLRWTRQRQRPWEQVGDALH